jgi:hypothetical protein
MGRQILVAMTSDDEKQFLTHLRQGARVVVLRPSAPTAEELRLDDLPEPGPVAPRQFLLWNTAFPWDEATAPTATGGVYHPNPHHGPLLEYVRDPLRRGAADTGRLYWGEAPCCGRRFPGRRAAVRVRHRVVPALVRRGGPVDQGQQHAVTLGRPDAPLPPWCSPDPRCR